MKLKFNSSFTLSCIVLYQYKQAEFFLWVLLGTVVEKVVLRNCKNYKVPPAPLDKMNRTDSAAILFYARSCLGGLGDVSYLPENVTMQVLIDSIQFKI